MEICRLKETEENERIYSRRREEKGQERKKRKRRKRKIPSFVELIVTVYGNIKTHSIPLAHD